MNIRRVGVISLLILSTTPYTSRGPRGEARADALRQHAHGSGGAPLSKEDPAAANHHACLEQERQALELGEGFGMAMIADRNGYPGPRHVLDLKAQLKLTPEQESQVAQLFARMHAQAVARGREVLLAEERLGRMFAQDRPEAELREEAYRIASLRAELRWVHLSAHVAARKLLSPEQLAAYQRLRHDGPASPTGAR